MDTPKPTQFDPITLEIIENSLQAAADEMFAAFRKTAMSSIIYEVLDMGTGVLDAQGESVSSGAGIPGFVGVLDKAVKVLIAKFGQEGVIHEGDVFITNDPYFGGVTHLNDIVIAMPVFVDGRLLAWTANIAHHSDVGGMAPGSLSGEAIDIFQEGIRLPAIKIIQGDRLIEPVMDILTANSRMPDVLRGDVWAGIAAARIGVKRIVELVKKYDSSVFTESMDKCLRQGELVSLKALAKLPSGTFELAETQDDGSTYKVKIAISEQVFLVDLTDNPEQVAGPINTSRDGVLVSMQMIFKAITDPLTAANGGSFKPLQVITRPGTVVDAQAPAAVGFYYEVKLRVYDLVWRCLAQQMPERLPAGHFASVCGTFLGGTHADTGRHYTIVEPQIGGWGGAFDRDGNSAMFCGAHGDTYNCPAEINEARNGLWVDQMALNMATGGEGEFTGGRGIVMDYRIRAPDSYLTAGYTRSKYPPWALNKGLQGSPNYIVHIPQAGMAKRYAFVSGLALQLGDVVRVVTGNGGGYGQPKNRKRESVLADYKNGFISQTHAQSVYGVSVT
ncbi:MAG TPA: methylhydantoinase [Oceanospirillaceae bacterium]|nr:methylhydantoinase [Oceanospirillaceae bacterium]